VLDALGTWRAPERPAASPYADSSTIALAPRMPASFLVVKAADGAAMGEFVLQSVYVDGRALPPPDLR